ncbi:hypothetical protein PF011_g16309 [Phytophthora fragariae]|uniref:RING-type domain-containing protein n=1 Tax=Phytophthora fragariae TaxID=53985 RepID=A0A6A3JK19_9STRA|nr:hypothetical protein PF011_g16309 [Phytophthora fragariae]
MGTGEALHIPRADPSAMSAYLPPQSSGLPYSAAGVSAPAAAGRPDAAYLPPPGSCMVCYNPSVDLLLEPCHHQFHAACIERWLSKDKVCPTCWTPIQAPRRLLTQQQQQQQYAVHMQQQQQQQQQQQGQENGGYPMDSKTHVLDGNAAAGTPTGASADAAAQQSSNPPTAMRKGKWTAEESAYCDRLIEEFKKGNLPLAEGTTLRTFLSKLLNCDPMRISKKYTGDQCIGKIIFRRREDEVSKDDMENIRKDLAELEKTYLEREQYNQRRREKRLESELSRDKSRFAAARSIGYAAAAGNPAAMRPQVQQPQQGGGYPPAAVQPMTKQEPRPVPGPQVQQPNYGAPGRAGSMPVQPPLHPPQQSNNVSSHLFNGDHSNVSMLGIAGAQTQAPNQDQDNKPPSSSGMDGNSGDAFPRVSSIDSFSCLFPRVASIENFQHATSSGFGGMNPSGSYASTETHNTMTSSGFDTQSVGLPKPLSIGEGLNAYFPRIQSLEQLSNLLQDHGPNSPRGAATDPSAQNTRDTMENANDNNKQLSNENSAPGGGIRRRLGETGIKEEQQREADVNPETESSSASNSSSCSSAVSTATSVTTSSTTKRLSPSHNTSASSGSGNQIQIPKPLNKMPRSSSGIFPRVPSMDKIPRVPSLDKLPRVASLDKLPRIPSMDKLHGMGGGEQRIPRVPSSDKMARVPSSDMLSRFGSSDHLSSFPSFSNLSSLSTSASYDKLSSLGGFKSGFPRNSSIEDILSLVASSESTGLPSNGSTLQLSALAAVAGEESSHIANERKRRLENSQQDAPLTTDKKSKLSA